MRPSWRALKAPQTSFIGREKELSSLGALLRSHRLLTITGPPGVGKTRLAQEFALRRRSDQEQEGIWFCDLSNVRDQEGLCIAVSQTLSIPLSLGDPVKQLAAAFAARGEEILLLDNCEQISGAAEAILSWYKNSSRVKFLATSRVKLSLPEEQLLELGPLPVPDGPDNILVSPSVQLFLDRARSARYGYFPSEQEPSAIGDLVCQLDGLPLAIELAAARMRLLTPAQIREHLAQRFSLLSRQGGEPRHETLFGAIDWSWDLLLPYEKAALSQCSVFRGGFSLEAAKAIFLLPKAPPILDILQSLLEQSLLYRYEPASFPEESRYALYVNIREYAEEKLNEGEKRELASRHARYFLEVSASWRLLVERRDEQEAKRRIQLEQENLLMIHRRALSCEHTLRAALALSSLMGVTGPPRVRFTILDEALAAGEGALVLRAASLHQRGIALQALGKTAEALRDFEGAKKLAESTDEQALRARILGSIAEHYVRAGLFKEAEAHFEQALAENQEADDPLWRGSLLNNLALLRNFQGGPEVARELFEEALQIHRQLGSVLYEGVVLGNLASIAAARGDLEEAKSLLERLLRIYRDDEAPPVPRALALANLGLIEQELASFSKAKEHFEGSLSLLRKVGHRLQEGIILGSGLGLYYQEVGASVEARASYEGALEIYQESKNPVQEGLVLGLLGSLAANEGKLEEARRHFAAAEERLKGGKAPLLSAAVSAAKGYQDLALWRIAIARGDLSTADELRSRAVHRIQEAKPLALQSAYIRTMIRLLSKSLSEISSSRETLQVATDGSWFCVPGGERVALGRRRSLPRLLLALAKQRQGAPRAPLSFDALLEIGWPKERLLPAAAMNRLYVAISTLRGLGLRDLLLSQEEGWLLHPDTPLLLVSSTKAAKARHLWRGS